MTRHNQGGDGVGVPRWNKGERAGKWEPHAGAELSARERQVLREIADGFSDRAIAARLAITVHTVHAFRRHLCRKTGCANRSHLTRYAVARGIVPSDWSPAAAADAGQLPVEQRQWDEEDAS